MPADFNGYWKMISNDNFEEYLKALDVNVAVRKIANLLKPDKEILQNGDHMIIKTLSTFRNYIMEFDVGKEFEEDLAGVDDRKCMFNNLSTSCRYRLDVIKGLTGWRDDKLNMFVALPLAVCSMPLTQKVTASGAQAEIPSVFGTTGMILASSLYLTTMFNPVEPHKIIALVCHPHLPDKPHYYTSRVYNQVHNPKETTVSWEGDKLLCVQKGEKEDRGWTQWIEGDEMHLEIRVCGVKCKQVFKKVQ